MAQKDAFLESEGDAYYLRNRGGTDRQPDLLSDALSRLQIAPTRILEIGCSDGRRLAGLWRTFKAECHGVDPSQEAIRSNSISDLHLSVGTADRLHFDNGFFDLVVFGFCLYLCDPQDHFMIAAEANRVLRDGGFLAISDFCPSRAYRNPYAHKPGLYAYKMDYARMFAWNPAYRLLGRSYYEHSICNTFDADEAAAVDVLKKDFAAAFPVATPKA
jgi:ubiquinone/menaquinone biosynthesis C-methylase UbiE